MSGKSTVAAGEVRGRMNRNKRLLAVVLAAGMIFTNAGYALAAQNSEVDVSETQETETQASQTETTETQAAESETAETQESGDGGLTWKKESVELIQGGDIVTTYFDEESQQPAVLEGDTVKKAEKAGIPVGTEAAQLLDESRSSEIEEGSEIRKASSEGSGSSSASSSSSSEASAGNEEKLVELQNIFRDAFNRYDESGEVDIHSLELDSNSTTDMALLKEAYETAVGGDDFYITGKFKVGVYDSGLIKAVQIGYGSSFRSANSAYRPDRDKITKAKEEFESAVSAAKSEAAKGSSELEKVLIIHDYLVTNCSYDYGNTTGGEYPDDDYTAYGVLVKHCAVCNGYAFAFSYILQQLGISSYIVDSDSMNHAWNLVQVGGRWYHVDTTRDDKVFTEGTTYYGLKNADYADLGYVSHLRFMRSDAEMKNMGYSDWKKQASLTDTIPSSAGSDFSAYLFRTNVDGEFYKSGGSWYLGSLSDRKIYRSSSLKKADARQVYADKGLMYTAGSGSLIYFSKTDGIYTYDTGDGSIKVVKINIGKKQSVSEMGICGGSLNYVLLNSSGSSKAVSVALSSVKRGTGWIKYSDVSKKYFIGARAVTGKVKIGKSYYYFNPSTARMTTGLVKIGKYWYYFSPSSGRMCTGWRVVNGYGYYFRSSGKAWTGKHKYKKYTYVFTKKGRLKKAPSGILTKYYYFSRTGRARTGWQKIRGRWYYFSKKNYKAYTGFHKIGKYYYDFSKSGKRRTGFIKVNGKRRYFSKKTGRMFKGWHKIGGKKYYFSKKTGAQLTGLVKIGKSTYYLYKKGGYAKGLKKIKDRKYYFRKNGKLRCVKNC